MAIGVNMATNETLGGLRDDMYAHGLSVTGRMETFREETDFPIDCFPSMVQEIVIGIRESMGFTIDYTAIAMLSVISEAIGNSTRIQNFRNWTEPCIMFAVIVGQPGSNKSHPLSLILDPLQELDDKFYKKYKEDYEEYDKQLRMSATKKDEEGCDSTKRPVRRQLIASDATIEALIPIMDENPHGICLYCDEFSSFLDNMDRYTHGSSEQAYLSLFNGKPISKNRKSENVSVRINNPFLTIIGTIQLDIMTDLMEGRRKKNGFFERLLLAFPKNEIYPYWSDLRQKDSNEFCSKWKDLVHFVYDESNRRMSEGGRILTLSEEACTVLDQWQKTNTERLKKEKNANIRDMYSKAAIYILRFCLLLQEFDNACLGTDKRIVSMFVANRAVKLSEYYINNSMRVIRYIYELSLKEDELDVFRALPEEFKFGDGCKIAIDVADNWYEKKFRRFLEHQNGMLFSCISHGIYRKLL